MSKLYRVGVDPSPKNTAVAVICPGMEIKFAKCGSPDLALDTVRGLVDADPEDCLVLVERLRIRGGSFGIAYSAATTALNDLKRVYRRTTTVQPQEWQRALLAGCGVAKDYFYKEVGRKNPTKSKSIFAARLIYGAHLEADPDIADAINIARYCSSVGIDTYAFDYYKSKSEGELQEWRRALKRKRQAEAILLGRSKGRAR